MRNVLASLVLASLLPLGLGAQTSPFLPDDLYRKLNNEISGDRAYDHLRTLTQYHAPEGATRDFHKAAEWIAGKAREAGLEDVQFHQLPFDGVAWSPLGGELWLLEPGEAGATFETRLGSYDEVATSIANYSRPTNVEAELVDVGEGTSEKDYEGRDVSGKIVLASGSPSTVEGEAVWKRGALGIVSYYSSRVTPSDYPDQVAWGGIHAKADAEGKEPSFAFMVSWRTGMALRAKLKGGSQVDRFAEEKEAPKTVRPIRVRVKIESEILSAGTHGLVEGWIRGRSNHTQQVVLTAHVQEERYSANDDRSGCANLLEIARALVRLIQQGKIPRPERDIRFWWVNEFDAPYDWFALHPEDRSNIFVDINQDMVGASLSMGALSRVQHVTRTPWSRPTFFNDVVESVITALKQGNNSYLAARQAGSSAPGSNYSRPIYSKLGSRDRYAVEIVPYFDSTDHHVFNDAFIAAAHGGVTFTNWPDEYIHSSDDDMWAQDRTTLQRNAVAVSALALYMANVGPRDAAGLASVVMPGAMARIFRDQQAAATAELEGRAGLCDAQNVAARALERELAAVDSLRSVAAGDVDALRAIAAARQKVAAAAAGTASCEPVSGPMVETMRAMKAKIPVRIASVTEYVKKRRDVKTVPGFHVLMRFEALNFADGQRSLWEVYEAVRAEAIAGGEWYYGKVSPEAVRKFFENAVAAGVAAMRDAPPPPPAKKKRN